jgi:hypothetical protein
MKIKFREALADKEIRNSVHGDLFQVAAAQIKTGIAARVIVAHQRLAEVSIDATHELHLAADELAEAEDVFLDIYGDAEVEL